MKGTDFILGVDAGSSVIKAVAFDPRGNEAFVHELPARLKRPHPLWMEQDMEEMWRDVKKCVARVARSVRQHHGNLLAIGVSSTGDGTWMIDARGRPVRNGILWCDGRAASIVNQWHAGSIAAEVFAICGTSVFTGSQAVQLAWLRQHEPSSLRNADVIFHAKDWLFYKLTGNITTDETDASLTMLRMSTRQYDAQLFKILKIGDLFDKFPPVRTTRQNTGALLPAVAQELGLPRGLPVGAGPMDVAACALGSGAIEHGEASSILGTAAIHQLIMRKPILKPSMVGMTLCHGVEKRWIRLIAAMTATPNLDWVLREVGWDGAAAGQPGSDRFYRRLEDVLRGVPPGSEGVLYHPYLFPGGERGPFVKPTARASFTGLSMSHGRRHLLRAVYEGVALSMFDCYRHMPIEPTAVYLSGGGSKSTFWCQLIADCLGKPVLVPAGSQFGAKGAAMSIGASIGIYASAEDSVRKTVRWARHYAPNRKNSKIYGELYRIYKATYESQMAGWDLRAQSLNQE
jgi:sugar (pentulose or hexulose) kinase